MAKEIERGKRLEALGLQEHVHEVAKHGQREGKEGKHHGARQLDVIKKVNRLIKKPEGRQASGGEQRNHQQGSHGKRGEKKAAKCAGLRRCWQ
jgi:hypothetical protein